MSSDALPGRVRAVVYRAAFRAALVLFTAGTVVGAVRGVRERAVLNLGATIEADDALAAGDLVRAGRQYEIATAVSPNDAGAWRGLGDVRMRQQRPVDALLPYEQALRNGLSDAALHSNLGYAYGVTGHLDAAVRQFERAAQLAPGDPRVRGNLAWAVAERDKRLRAGAGR